MYYHLIMVVKYRRKVMNDEISERAKEIFEYIAESYGITLEEWNHDEDHVHVMFRAKPSSKRCSACGRIKDDLTLSERIYRCSCGNCIDRDVNAAINIRMETMRLMAS